MTVGESSSRKQKKTTTPVKSTKHKIELTTVMPRIEVEGNLLGHVHNLKYVDHDVQDLASFLYMVEKHQLGEFFLLRNGNGCKG